MASGSSPSEASLTSEMTFTQADYSREAIQVLVNQMISQGVLTTDDRANILGLIDEKIKQYRIKETASKGEIAEALRRIEEHIAPSKTDSVRAVSGASVRRASGIKAENRHESVAITKPSLGEAYGGLRTPVRDQHGLVMPKASHSPRMEVLKLPISEKPNSLDDIPVNPPTHYPTPDNSRFAMAPKLKATPKIVDILDSPTRQPLADTPAMLPGRLREFEAYSPKAVQIMLAQGWQPGRGLGPCASGITTPLQPTLTDAIGYGIGLIDLGSPTKPASAALPTSAEFPAACPVVTSPEPSTTPQSKEEADAATFLAVLDTKFSPAALATPTVTAVTGPRLAGKTVEEKKEKKGEKKEEAKEEKEEKKEEEEEEGGKKENKEVKKMKKEVAAPKAIPAAIAAERARRAQRKQFW